MAFFVGILSITSNSLAFTNPILMNPKYPLMISFPIQYSIWQFIRYLKMSLLFSPQLKLSRLYHNLIHLIHPLHSQINRQNRPSLILSLNHHRIAFKYFFQLNQFIGLAFLYPFIFRVINLRCSANVTFSLPPLINRVIILKLWIRFQVRLPHELSTCYRRNSSLLSNILSVQVPF